MNITGVEVIRRNPGVGAIGVVAGEKIELTYDDTLRVNVSFDYRGLAGSTILYGAIGQVLWPTGRFDPILKNEVSIDLPESIEFTPCERSVDIPITSDISPRSDYDLRVKFPDYLEVGQPQVDDVIDIVGIPPTFELLEETIYPYAYIYDGECDVSTFTFKTDPFTPASWIAGKLASHFENEVRKAGGRVMEMRVYCDKTPLLWTDWRIEVVGIPLQTTAGVAMPLGLVWWAAILVVAFAIIAVIIVATLATKTIVELFNRNPALKDAKPAWGKETLVSAIQDAEEYWEHTPTSPEELDGKSEEELRVLLDEIVEREVPPADEVPWGLIAAVAGIGILGAGAAVVFAAKPKE